QAAACAALDDKAFVRKSMTLVAREMKFMEKALTDLGVWFKKSAANFIFVRTGMDARSLFGKMLKKGVIIREMSQYNLDNYSRITIGTRRENIKLIRALRDIIKEDSR
ncbi:MAG: aminotransferase class I/II-fold pyridoxal phosphate-dependent enzyme, partial [Candidatus Velamenicoccus archaeovorus]